MGSAQLRVLVVDDSRVWLHAVKHLAGRYDCTVRTCQSSIEATQIAQDFAPQVVILDIQMPGLDGYMVAEDLGELDLPEYTLVAMSSFSDEAHRRECEVAGFDAFLEKPASMGELQRVLDAAKAKYLPEDR